MNVAAWARRAGRLSIAVLFAGWTGYWIVAGNAYLHEHSIVVQQGFGGDGIQMWEIFNIKMVAAHQLVRWAAGALPMLGLLYATRLRVPAAADASEPVFNLADTHQTPGPLNPAA